MSPATIQDVNATVNDSNMGYHTVMKALISLTRPTPSALMISAGTVASVVGIADTTPAVAKANNAAKG